MATCSDSEHSINQERKIKINKKLTLIGFDDWANGHCAIFTENENEET